jgi:hypothetical protein
VAYLHHGLLMNSEVWVCLTDSQRCLAFELVDRGFDVWVRFPDCTDLSTMADVLSSSETTAATSTRRRLSTAHQHRKNSGTSPLTNSPSTISRTRSATFLRRPNRRVFLTSVSRRVQRRLSLPLPFTPSSIARSTCLSDSHRLWPQLVSRMAWSTRSSRHLLRFCSSCLEDGRS